MRCKVLVSVGILLFGERKRNARIINEGCQLSLFGTGSRVHALILTMSKSEMRYYSSSRRSRETINIYDCRKQLSKKRWKESG